MRLTVKQGYIKNISKFKHLNYNNLSEDEKT